MEKLCLEGIIPPVVTPFDQNEVMDEGALRREVRFLADAGVHGVSFGGSTGEGALLSDEELVRGVEICREEVTGKLPVICGIIRNSTRDAIKAGRSAGKAGADVLMVTPVHYHQASEAGNIHFYRTVAQETGLSVIVYNVVKNNPILPQVMEEISEIQGIVGLKQSYGGIHMLTDMIYRCGGKIKVFAAQDDLLFASYLLGADGAISAVLSVFPELCVRQWDAVKSGNLKLAREIHYRILPVWRRLEGGDFPAKIKAALRILGRDAGMARSPLMEPPAEEMEEMMDAIRKAFSAG